MKGKHLSIGIIALISGLMLGYPGVIEAATGAGDIIEAETGEGAGVYTESETAEGAEVYTESETAAGSEDHTEAETAAGTETYTEAEAAAGSETVTETETAEGAGDTTEIETTAENEETLQTLSIVVTGDNLIHSPLYNKARQADGTYNFNPMYDNIKETIQKYDLAVVNQETIFVNDERNVSTYPCFGTPSSMGGTLVDVGFDVVLSATNHTWDKKATGFYDTINFWKGYPEITLLGIHETPEDYNTVDIVEKNGFRLAMFNYTYGLNGFKLPGNEGYKVNLLSEKDKFLSDIRSVEGSCDFTICFVHIGTEYVYTPTAYQVGYINDLIDAGADIIVCAHPHVIEPYGMVATSNGNTGLVYYSCGNFISNQLEVPRVLGGLAEINLSKTDGVSRIESFDFIPVVTHYNNIEHSVYLLKDYTDDLARTHSLASKGLSVPALWDIWNRVIGKRG